MSYVKKPEPPKDNKYRYYARRVIPNWDYIRTLLVEGYKEYEVARAIGISKTTWYKYKQEFPEFEEHVDISRRKLQAQLEQGLYRSALGLKNKKTTTVKQVYNKYSGEWVDRERTVQETDNDYNVPALLASLKYISKDWKDVLDKKSTDDPDDSIVDVIDSIGDLIDKIQSDDDET